jgi:hypothetical protein
MLQKQKANKPEDIQPELKADEAMKAVVAKAKTVMKGFKTAEELNLTQRQHKALVKTLELMEAGKVRHVKPNAFDDFVFEPNGKYVFNMSVWRQRNRCGTVCCLGGTAEMLDGDLIFSHVFELPTHNPLWQLFYKRTSENITDKQAAKALRGYLETGITDWKAALAK